MRGNRTRRARKNPAEQALEELMRAQGWFVTKRGWPDFILWREDELLVVEVKPKRLNSYPKVGKKQQFVLDVLRRHGIPVKVWSPDIGFWDGEAPQQSNVVE